MTTLNLEKRFLVSWEELHRDAKALAWRLHDAGTVWKGIIAVTRGGLVPAAVVARELELRIFETVAVIGYELGSGDKTTQNDPKIIKQPANVGNGEGWLVVDDLVDTGRTIEILRGIMPEAHYAAVYAKPLGKPMIDTYVTEVSQDTWIYLPWDVELQFSQPISIQRRETGT